MFVAALIFGMMVLLLSLPLWGGLPPIYRPFGKPPEAELRRLLPHLFLIFPAMAAFVLFERSILLALMGAVGLWCGSRIRRIIAATGAAPRFARTGQFLPSIPCLRSLDAWRGCGSRYAAADMTYPLGFALLSPTTARLPPKDVLAMFP